MFQKIFLLVLLSLAFVFCQSAALASPIQIEPGDIYKSESFPHKFVGKVNDVKSKFDVHVFEYKQAADGLIFVGVSKDGNIILFYFFHPAGISKDKILGSFGKNYMKVNNSFVYGQLNMFVEFNDKNEVMTIGKFLNTKDI